MSKRTDTAPCGVLLSQTQVAKLKRKTAQKNNKQTFVSFYAPETCLSLIEESKFKILVSLGFSPQNTKTALSTPSKNIPTFLVSSILPATKEIKTNERHFPQKQLQPHFPTAGNFQRKNDDTTTGCSHYKAFSKLQPHFPTAGNFRRKNDDTTTGRSHYKAFRKLQPHFPTAGNFRRKNDDTTTGRSHYKAFRKLQPHFPTTGNFRRKNDDTTTGRSHYKAFSKLQPHFPTAGNFDTKTMTPPV